jgi:hypothetical protein
MSTLRITTVLSLLTLPFVVACSSDGGSAGGGAGIDCTGVDGTYYYAITGTGDCASLGTAMQDQGMVVQNHGVMVGSMSGCSSNVTYEGCTITSEFSCASDVSITATQTFAPGNPGMVSGTQTQTSPTGNTCVFEIYGSTDLALVQEHAGVSGTGGISELATPSTPTPSNLAAATTECEANAQAEETACPTGNDVTAAAARCANDWSMYDAEGCGDAWRAYTTCRTEKVGNIDCSTGEIADCTVYQNAYFQCQSAFVSATGCTVAGEPATNCAGGLGTYSYACMTDTPPKTDCATGLAPSGAVKMFCCY